MADVLYRSTTCNVEAPDSNGEVASTVATAWKNADVLKLNEASESSTLAVMRALPGVAIYRPGGGIGSQNPIMWRKAVFDKLDAGWKTCYVGGKGDGPSRGIVWVLLRHRASRARVLEFNWHQIHKAWTTVPSRQGEWNQIMREASEEINRVRAKYPGVPIVISGDANRDDNVNFLNLAEVEVSLPPTYGGNKHYDKFHLYGGIQSRGYKIITTKSDHKAVMLNLRITTISTGMPAPTPAPVPTVTPKPAAPATPAETSRRLATFHARPKWRYFAQRVDGGGAMGPVIHHNLPLEDVEIEDVLTGHNGLSATISAEYRSLIGDDGDPILDDRWNTAIWAEESGNIHGGGILNSVDKTATELSLECVGLTGYTVDTPYSSANFFVEVDSLDIFRHIWTHLQSQPNGNLGLEIDTKKSGKLLGTDLEQVEFDTTSGPVSFEAGPYKLAWYQDHDLADNLGNLAADTPFDWHEEHFWDGDVLRHFLRIGLPRIGRRREDLRFVLGENIFTVPSLVNDGVEYADEVWALGAGEGSAMLRGVARRQRRGLRRVRVVSDSALRSKTGVNGLAEREVAWRNQTASVTDVEVINHPHADIASVQTGDEVLLQGKSGWVKLGGWYRVTARTIRPEDTNVMKLTLVRSDRVV